jgi:uncharacterized membrane protein YhaH (DUF805 family)/predicted RNA-binding Zn-ribbon protein involved in translation (DUF1610 family)
MDRQLKKCPYCGKEILGVAKKCRYCGKWIDGDHAHMTTCSSCGEKVDKTSKECPYCGEPLTQSHESEGQPMTEPDATLPQTEESSAQETPQPTDETTQPANDSSLLAKNGSQSTNTTAQLTGETTQDEQNSANDSSSTENATNGQEESAQEAAAPDSNSQDTLSFDKAVKRCFDKYAVFEGRASKAEFWWFALACGIAYAITYALCLLIILNGGELALACILANVVSGLTMLPLYSAATRRLHDTNKSGWYLFIQLIPVAGPFIFLYMLCEQSGLDNQYGTEDSRYAEGTNKLSSRDEIVLAVYIILMILGVAGGLFIINKGMGNPGASDNFAAATDSVEDSTVYDEDSTAYDQSDNSSGDQTLDLAEEVYKKCYYDRYGDGEDSPTYPYGYQVSPDGKYLFIVTNVGANGSGWMTEYQLQRYNIETGDLRFITDCAGIIMNDDGIAVAKARVTNEETAQSEAEYNYRVYEVHYSWDGKNDYSSHEEEGSFADFENTYTATDGGYVSGVERFPQSFIDSSRE